MSTARAQIRSVIERYVTAYRSGDTSYLRDIIAPEYVDHTVPAFGDGPDGVARAIQAFHRGFSDVSCSLEQCVCEGDSAAFRVVVAATHTGAFAGRPATGRRITWSAADFVRLRDGKLVELWTVQDTLPLRLGIGVVREVSDGSS